MSLFHPRHPVNLKLAKNRNNHDLPLNRQTGGFFMQPTDFARKSLGGAYLNRTDTLFDKAFNQNGKVNSFVTKSSGTWGGADKDLAAKVKGKK